MAYCDNETTRHNPEMALRVVEMVCRDSGMPYCSRIATIAHRNSGTAFCDGKMALNDAGMRSRDSELVLCDGKTARRDYRLTLCNGWSGHHALKLEWHTVEINDTP